MRSGVTERGATQSVGGSTRRAGVLGWVRRVGWVIVAVVVVEYAAVHLLTGARESWTSIGSADPVPLVIAFALELTSWTCFSGLTSTLLPKTRRPRYPAVLAIDLTGNGLSRVVPGGGATAAALRFRLLGRAGSSLGDAVGAATLQSAITSLWLVAAFLVGLVMAVPQSQTRPFLKTASVLVTVLLVTFGGLVAVLMARPDQVVAATRAIARRLPLLRPQALERFVRTVIAQVRLLLSSRERSREAVLWGLGYWALDAACLYLSVLAYGVTPNLGGLLATYTLVSLVALLPLTPGGLGLVEGVAVPALVSFGTPQDAALLGVLTWRLFQFWLPIPVALFSYLWLRFNVLGRVAGSDASQQGPARHDGER